ncbi:HAD-IIB family hydrolase [Curvivirga aplysinae]|uniref:HAD-IIB family hydrolase n=1 Tax=Curvivirga aplysinae TaxID=2529852 RepID=UPI0012BCE382|nr:HAD-IIB family hydrolase [Curvivirga aplysinae]MTI10098.1 HAD-IIB family hydrolase [Curvivirga aplysinae]
MSIQNLPDKWPHKTKILFTDIDDTLTWEGQLPLETYKALHDLRNMGIKVVPVTGGSAGWADCLIRTWPIDTIITENGSMWLSKDSSNKVTRHYYLNEIERQKNWQRLNSLKREFRSIFPNISDTEDQDFRLTDIAFDIGQQVSIERSLALQAANWWKEKGALARCSSIHINVWMGEYDKAQGALKWLQEENASVDQNECAFVGDSPNDEAMFTHFDNTVGVANISAFFNDLKDRPKYLTSQKGGYGFVELANSMITGFNELSS